MLWYIYLIFDATGLFISFRRYWSKNYFRGYEYETVFIPKSISYYSCIRKMNSGKEYVEEGGDQNFLIFKYFLFFIIK